MADQSYTTNTIDELGSLEILRQTFVLLKDNLASFFAICLVAYTPFMFVVVGMFEPQTWDNQVQEGELFAFNPALSLYYFGSLIVEVIIASSLTYWALRYFENDRATVTEMFKVGMDKFIPVFCATIMMYALILLGFIFLIIPGIIISIMVTVTIPVLIDKSLSPIEALNRSYQLTKGHKLPIFAGLLFLWVTHYALNFLGTFVFGFDVGYVMSPNEYLHEHHSFSYAAYHLIGTVFYYAISYSYVSAVYEKLRHS